AVLRHCVRRRVLYVSSFTLCFFFFNAPATTEIYTLSLHDALPIYCKSRFYETFSRTFSKQIRSFSRCCQNTVLRNVRSQTNGFRSEEHTSELQSRENLVCRLLLEKKKIYTTIKGWILSCVNKYKLW